MSFSFFFFFNDTATTEIYTLSLHDALPISVRPETSNRTARRYVRSVPTCSNWPGDASTYRPSADRRSEEHTSELQSQSNLVCRLLLEKKKKKKTQKKKNNRKQKTEILECMT